MHFTFRHILTEGDEVENIVNLLMRHILSHVGVSLGV